MEPNNGFGLDDLGQFADQLLDSIGGNMTSRANNAQATAEYNSALADLVRSKARNETNKTQSLNKAVNTLVIGLLLILGVYVIAKFLVPKLK